MKRDEVDITELLFSVTPHGKEGNETTMVCCAQCNRSVTPTRCIILGNKYFCSMDCYTKGHNEKKMETCAFCGKEIRVFYATGGRHFCPDSDCLAKFQDGERPRPKPNPSSGKRWPKGW